MSTVSVRVDAGLFAQAAAVGRAEYRSGAQQLSYWAMLGKNTLANPDLPIEYIQELLVAKELKAANEAIRHIMSYPEAGTEKKQDLAGIRVYKYKVDARQYLLAYTFDPVTLQLLLLGVHENFNRDLKNYLR